MNSRRVTRAVHGLAAGVALVTALAAPAARAGKIPGLPAPIPPSREALLHFSWENDFLGRGGEFDDHRTQQLSVDAILGGRWHVVIDHSILTHEGPRADAPDPLGQEGRLDEWSVSLARRWRSEAGRLLVGLGIRDIGEYGGERIQNGFHRLVGSRVVDLPYLTTRRTRPTVWLTLDREHVRPVGARKWQGGVWLSAAAQLAHGGRSDLRASAQGIARRRAFEVRLGLHADWREGSRGNLVESRTAESERGLFGVLGLGIGPLEMESYQRVDGGSAYGRAVWRAGPSPTAPSRPPGRYGLILGLRLPETAWRAGGAWSPQALERAAPGDGRLALVVDYFHGATPEPTSDFTFRLERQLTAGLAWRLALPGGWITPLGSIGAGWRREQIEGTGFRTGAKSAPADRAVLTAEGGTDLRMAELGAQSQLALRLSLTCHVPLSDHRVQLAGQSHRLPGAGAGISVSLVYATGQ